MNVIFLKSVPLSTGSIRNPEFSKGNITETAYAFSGDKEKAIEAGCNNYITKPINKTLLTKLVKSYFN